MSASYKILKSFWVSYQVLLGVLLIVLLYCGYRIGKEFHYWDIQDLKNKNPRTTAFIKSHAITPHKEIKHWTPLENIPAVAQHLLLIAEDGKFYEHGGFDFEQIQYAIVANHQKGKPVRGASTLSQQVAKNLYLSSDKTMVRKGKEAVITLLLEHILGKKRILEIYCNIAQTGPDQFGLEEGARYHYGKSLQALSHDQWVGLIAVIPNPKKWSPKRYSPGYQRHRNRIIRNSQLYRDLLRKSTLDSIEVLQNIAEENQNAEWDLLRDRGYVPYDTVEADSAVEVKQEVPEGSIDTSTSPEPTIP